MWLKKLRLCLDYTLIHHISYPIAHVILPLHGWNFMSLSWAMPCCYSQNVNHVEEILFNLTLDPFRQNEGQVAKLYLVSIMANYF